MRRLIFILLAIIGVSQAQTIQYIGAPTTTVISRGNFRTDSIFYLPKRSKAPTDTAAFRYQISDSSLYVWTGSQWRKVGADADTLVYSTRAWRQKGDDSLSARINLKVNISDTSSMLTNYVRHAGYGLTKSSQSFLVDTASIATRARVQKAVDSLQANINAKGNGTVTSVATGYGLSGGTITTSGTLLVDTLNIATRAWRQKGLDSLAALEVSGSGTTNYVPKFTASGTIGNSQIFDNGTNVGIGTTAPNTKTEIFGGDARVSLAAVSAATFRGYQMGSGTTEFASLKAEASFGELRLTSGFAGFGGFTTMYTNGSERLRITSGGDVGINQPSLLWTATNRRLLELNGTSQSLIGLNVNNLKAGYIWQNGNDMTIAVENAGYIQFGTNGSSDRMRIFSNGRIGVNTITDAGYQLDVNGTLRSVNGANFATTSGNVGVGVTNPDGKLELFGGTLTAGTVGTYALLLGNSSRQIMSLGTDANYGYIQTWGSRSLNLNSQGNNTIINSGSGEVLIGTTSDAGDYKLQVAGAAYLQGVQQNATQTILRMAASNASAQIKALDFQINAGSSLFVFNTAYAGSAMGIDFADAGTSRMRVTADGEVLVNTTSDAGDYKLQVVGNARIGTGKLDIASNTTFGIGVARSGTSEVAGQIYNSNGILYFGAESSAGGQIFSGSSAYAGVIGTGANYPLQFAVNNITRGGFSTSGNLLLGFTTDSYFLKLQVNGSIFTNNQFFGQGVNAQLSIDSSTNISPIYVSNQSLTGSSAQGLLYGSSTWNTTGNPSLIDLAITNTASGATSNYIKISDGSNIFRVTKAAEVVTAAPTGGSIRKWKLGEAATVSPTSPNRTIRVEIDGTVYYIHAKTTND